MKFQVRRCRTCGASGVGPVAAKLYEVDGALYCEQGSPKKPGCWRLALTWYESRGQVFMGLQHELKAYQKPRKQKNAKQDWHAYIVDLCEMAGFGLEVGDRRTFVFYASKALLAWDLKGNL